MKNLISTLFSICLFVQICFTQIKSKYPSAIILDNDSLMCFTLTQSKQLAVWNENRKECIEIQKEESKKFIELDKISKTQIKLINNLEQEIIHYKNTIEDKNKLISVCEDEKNTLKREVKKQRRGKIIAVIGGLGLFILTIVFT
jgi:septal ring factor EnvC (AmiA/AmiB activator)